MKHLITLFALFTVFAVTAQENNSRSDSYLIVQTSKSYNSALRKAQKACNKLGLTLNLFGNIENKEKGLMNYALDECGKKLGYTPRSCGEAGKYVSIEYSTAVPTLKKESYLIVVASGELSQVESTLNEVKKVYKNAFVQEAAF